MSGQLEVVLSSQTMEWLTFDIYILHRLLRLVVGHLSSSPFELDRFPLEFLLSIAIAVSPNQIWEIKLFIYSHCRIKKRRSRAEKWHWNMLKESFLKNLNIQSKLLSVTWDFFRLLTGSHPITLPSLHFDGLCYFITSLFNLYSWNGVPIKQSYHLSALSQYPNGIVKSSIFF